MIVKLNYDHCSERGDTAGIIPQQLPAKTGDASKAWRIFAVLLVLMAVIAIQSYHTRNEPLERDMPTYAVVAHELLGGRALYSDVFDQKPPAVYATYALAEKSLRLRLRSQPALIYLGVIVAWISLFGVFVAASGLSGSASCGLVASAAWVVIGSDLELQANQPNTEVFMNACIVWAFAFAARYQSKPPGISASICVGLLAALATLFKPAVAMVPICIYASVLRRAVRIDGDIRQRERAALKLCGYCLWR